MDREQRAKEIAAAALQRPAAERSIWIRSTAGGDEQLRRRAEELVAHSPNVTEIEGAGDGSKVELGHEPGRRPDLDTPYDAPPPTTPRLIGSADGDGSRYELGAQIGEGGFGVVHAATQTHPVRREVAIKLLRDLSAARDFIERFERERQTLAMLEHPSIARVYDAGTTNAGAPYFVMELVRGVPIDRFCDRERLPVDDRLRLGIEVCDAVAHAHSTGIIHRDLKPPNVMVGEVNGHPIIKVIDFGIAVGLRHSMPGVSSVSADRDRFVGTRRYASPEQHALEPDIDARADVYALGVMLCELVAGDVPTATDTVGETNSARSPVHLLTELAPPSRQQVAERRRVSLDRLTRRLRGDLGEVLSRAVAIERTNRYQSVSELRADLQRVLDDDVPVAAPATPGRTLRLVKRRHPAAIPVAIGAAAVLFGLAAVPAIIGSSRAGTARSDAVAARAEAASARDAAAAFERDLAQISEAIFDRAFDAVDLDIGAPVAGVIAASMEDPSWLDDRGPATRAIVLRLHGLVLSREGNHAAAAETYAEGATAATIAFGEDDPDTLHLQFLELDALAAAESLGERISEFESIAERQATALGENAAAVFATRNAWAQALLTARDFDAAIELHRTVLADRETAGDRDGVFESLNNLALTYETLGQTIVDPPAPATAEDRTARRLERISAYESAVQFSRRLIDETRGDATRPTRKRVRNIGNDGRYHAALAQAIELVPAGDLAERDDRIAAASERATDAIREAHGIAGRELDRSDETWQWITMLYANHLATFEGRLSRDGNAVEMLSNALATARRIPGRPLVVRQMIADLGLSQVLRGSLRDGINTLRELEPGDFEEDTANRALASLVYLARGEAALGDLGDGAGSPGALDTYERLIATLRDSGRPTEFPAIIDLEVRIAAARGRSLRRHLDRYRTLFGVPDGGSIADRLIEIEVQAATAIHVARALVLTGDEDASRDAIQLLENPGLRDRIESFRESPRTRSHESSLAQSRERERLLAWATFQTGDLDAAVRIAEQSLDRATTEAPFANAERSELFEILVRALPASDPRSSAAAEMGRIAAQQARYDANHPRATFFRDHDSSD